MSNAVPQVLSTMGFETKSFTNLELAKQARLIGQKSPGIHLSLSSLYWDYKQTTMPPYLKHGFQGSNACKVSTPHQLTPIWVLLMSLSVNPECADNEDYHHHRGKLTTQQECSSFPGQCQNSVTLSAHGRMCVNILFPVDGTALLGDVVESLAGIWCSGG